METRGKHGMMTDSKIAMAILNVCSNITPELNNSIIFRDLQKVVKKATVKNKTNQDNNSNLLVSNPDNTNINLGQNNLTNSQMQNEGIYIATVENKINQHNNSNSLVSDSYKANTDSQMQDKNIDNVQSENNCSWFDIVVLILAVVGLLILTIITLGAIFWGPALFDCCRNNDISSGIENQQSVQNSPAQSDIKLKNPENQIQAQSGNNNIEENLNHCKNKST